MTLKNSIPETIDGLEIFIKECAKEINKYSKLQEIAQETLDMKTGQFRPSYGLHQKD